jgi:hypothetical protein
MSASQKRYEGLRSTQDFADGHHIPDGSTNDYMEGVKVARQYLAKQLEIFEAIIANEAKQPPPSFLLNFTRNPKIFEYFKTLLFALMVNFFLLNLQI